MLSLLFYFSFASYIIVIICISIYIYLKKKNNLFKTTIVDGISVVIAFRNEQDNLRNLLLTISCLEVPNCPYEFIFVNDRSEDLSIELIQNFKLNNSHIKLIDSSEILQSSPGKKNALQHGINAAYYSILAFTDADCLLPLNWLKEIEKQFSNGCDVLIGKAPLISKSPSFLTDWQETETFFSHLLAYLSYCFNYSSLSFGRNFAYTKSIFNKVGGFSSIKNSQSGDDDLLLSLFTKAQANITFSSNHSVESSTEKGLKRWHRQKIRHYSVLNYMNKLEQIVSYTIHTWHVLIYIGILTLGAWHLLFIKSMTDFLLFYSGNKHLKFSNIFKNLFLWECFYAVLNLYFMITIKFVSKQSTRWK